MTMPAEIVTAFFDAYRARDVEAMVGSCSDRAEFHYVPFEIWGKQRVLRGDGSVRGSGKVLWTGLIDAFPDLTNEVTSVHSDAEGNVAVEVVISGTQARVWGSIANRGRRFSLPHLFVMRVRDTQIESISAYWDGAEMNRQLGRVEID